ncbi:MAG: UvrB/UvrC motif-containing protein [Planctomycetes bacterium]|nr:UvrB/UvrC motif-containing protein [Planctomycetota bacterium]
MKCQFCDSPATVHLTDIINKKKHEVHICEACAREHDLIPDAKQELNVPALLQFLLNQKKGEKAKNEAIDLVCPHCGMKYAQFRTQGRLGCPKDYEVFRAALEPLLERIHRHVRHEGKVPRSVPLNPPVKSIEEMQQRIRDAVLEERYEEAARLRDLIRSMRTAE